MAIVASTGIVALTADVAMLADEPLMPVELEAMPEHVLMPAEPAGLRLAEVDIAAAAWAEVLM
jgi:hypothetical protein